MKNKRNTRRGRAKRWHLLGFWESCPIYSMHGSMVEVWLGLHTKLWFVGDGGAPFMPVTYATRAAAMRAAEHLARRR